MTLAVGAPRAPNSLQVLSALIVGQICLHSCMTGVRMAAPLQVLRAGYAEWAVGILLGLFAAAPVLIALAAGRFVDRRGYHAPMRVAVLLTAAGGAVAVASTWLAAGQFFALCVAAMLTGAGTNFGLIAMQHTAGRHASDATALKQVFSWLGLAPAVANVFGPVLAGLIVDFAGFGWAFAVLALMPLFGFWSVRRVPVQQPTSRAPRDERRSSWDLLRAPGVGRLLFVNWLLSASWDLHAFVVPILGHERGFSASAIGVVLGAFAAAVTLVRLVIPAVAHRLRESQVLAVAMLCTGAVLGVYPFVQPAWLMSLCAVLLGLALGAVQPMILSSLHQLTPPHRHGEAIALRSMTISLASTLMPLLFGAAGAVIGAASLFWAMGLAVALGSTQAGHVGCASDRSNALAAGRGTAPEVR
jgi:MFS family permease